MIAWDANRGSRNFILLIPVRMILIFQISSTMLQCCFQYLFHESVLLSLQDGHSIWFGGDDQRVVDIGERVSNRSVTVSVDFKQVVLLCDFCCR